MGKELLLLLTCEENPVFNKVSGSVSVGAMPDSVKHTSNEFNIDDANSYDKTYSISS